MFWAKFNYFAKVFDTIWILFWKILLESDILFRCFVEKCDIFQMLHVKILTKIWCLSNILRKTVDTLEYFEPETNTFRVWRSNNFEMFCLEILHCSNMLGTNMILFECFAQNSNTPQTSLVEIQHSSNFSSKIKYFVDVLDRASILFQCFGYE